MKNFKVLDFDIN